MRNPLFAGVKLCWFLLAVPTYNPFMTLSVPLSDEVEAKLREKAVDAGMDVHTFIARTLERIAMRPSLDEVLRPIRDEFHRDGMSDDELAQFLEDVKHEARRTARGSRA